MQEEYLKEITLPSRGKFYGDKLPSGIITIEPLGTREEKLFAAGKSGSLVLNKIYEQCVTLPIPHSELVLGDRFFTLLQLRQISYGDDYRYSFRCSECRKKSWASVKISKIPIKYAEEDATELFPARLPVLGVDLTLRHLTGNDEDRVTRYVEQLSKKRKGDASEVEYIYRLARRIEEIDGQKVGIKEAMELVEKVKGQDSLAIRDACDQYAVGPDMEDEPVCNSCGYPNDIIVPFDVEFFRPRRHRSRSDDYLAAAEDFDASGEAVVE